MLITLTAPHLFVTTVNVNRYNEKLFDRTITETVNCPQPFRKKARRHGIWLSVVRGA